MADDQVDLGSERDRIEDMWRGMSHTYVPLAVAAAMTFHQVQGNTRAIISRQDYDDALNLAAAALSRLVTVYTMAGTPGERRPLSVDLIKQHFVRGATELRATDGSRVLDLSVLRGEILSAISLVKRAGLPFSLALATPKAAEPEAAPEPGKTIP